MPRRDDAPTIYLKVAAPGSPGVRVDQSARIENLSYEDEAEKFDKLTLTVDNYDNSTFDSGLWREGSEIEVQWGYPGRMSPARLCVVQNITGGAKLKVEAHDKGVLLHKEKKQRSWVQMKRSDIVRQVAEEWGFDDDTMFVEDTAEVLASVVQASVTDATFLSDLAQREGFDWFVDFDGFHFHQRQLDQTPASAMVYFYGNELETDILDWGISKGVGSKKAGKVKAEGRNPDTKEDITVTGSKEDTPHTALAPIIDIVDKRDGTKHQSVLAKNTANEHTVPTTAQTAEVAKREVDGVYKRGQLKAVELNVKAWGDPWVVAKTVREILGIGAALSGNYYLKKVKHSVGSGYQMDLELARDGTSKVTNVQAFEKDEGVPSKTPNQAKPEDGKDVGPVDKVDKRTGVKTTEYKDGKGRPAPATAHPTGRSPGK